MAKKLTRNNRDKMIAGVSSGLADYFQLDVIWVRIAFILATFFGGSGLWIYIILWIAIPENRISIFSYENTDEPSTEAENFVLPEKENASFNGNLIGGTVLIILGSYFLLHEFDLIPYWFSISKLWPLILVAIGLFVIFKSARKESRITGENDDTVNKKDDGSEKENEESIL